LGRSGIDVPVIGMGTWKTFDVRASKELEKRNAIVDAALGAGTNLFDTSPMYGESERVLAAAVSKWRDAACIADKVWTSSPREGREQIDRALEWYGGRVDIYQIHNLVAWREHLPVLEDLRARGSVTVIGATHYSHGAMRDLMEVMVTGRIQMVQIPYNAADTLVEREILPLARDIGIGVLVMQPLGTGTLVRNPPDEHAMRPLRAFGVRTWAQALLKWIVSDPRVHAVLPATSRVERARENAGAGDPPWLDEETRGYVRRLATGRRS
jgi:aryl-alcohol dehydrogenase-like predicted oxidoreductase